MIAIRGVLGCAIFWLVTLGVAYVAAVLLDHWLGTSIFHVPSALHQAWSSWTIQPVRNEDFATGLAFGVIAAAIGLAVGFLVRHVLPIRLRIARLKVRLAKAMAGSEPTIAFAAHYDESRDWLERDPLVGHAARQFFDTVDDRRALGGSLRSTLRPGAFLNSSVARAQLTGLQIMPVIPGYFVGVGLLFTFVGIVLALHEAAGGMSGDATRMTAAVQQLMAIASFKFATSIAGLAASIVLGFVFKLYAVWIDAAFHGLCARLERGLQYEPPQTLSAQMARSLDAQVEELKAINNDRFFARFGEQLLPGLEGALSRAMSPVITSLRDTTQQIADSSSRATSEAIGSFATTVQGAAGEELRALAGTLGEMRSVLEALQHQLASSGQATAEQLLAAAATMTKGLNASGATAASSMESAISEVLRRIDDRFLQMDEVMAALSGRLTENARDLGARVKETSAEVQVALRDASIEAAVQLRGGLADVLAEVHDAMGGLAGTAATASAGLERQSAALGRAADTTASASAAFRDAAEDMRRTAEPVRSATRELAGGIATFQASVANASATYAATQEASRELASELAAHSQRLREFWASYEDRFAGVDRELRDAVVTLGEETGRYQERVQDFVTKLDHQFARATDNLAQVVSDLETGVQELNAHRGRPPLVAVA